MNIKDLEPYYSDMRRLHADGVMSLRQIAKKYGVSTKTVWRIVGRGVSPATRKKQNFIQNLGNLQSKTVDEIVDEFGVCKKIVLRFVGKYRHKVIGGNPGVGAKWEEWVAMRLTTMGLAVKLMPYGYAYDLLVSESIRVDVKVCTKPKWIRGAVNPQYCFRLGDKEKKVKADFYILVIAGSEDVFVVPSSCVSDDIHSIGMCWPSARPHLGKYQQYHNAWGLLTK